MSRSAQTGRLGERYAANLLRCKGYQIVQANYRRRGGEIDIIAQKDGFLVFVEVKTRPEGALVDALESMGVRKQRCIIRTARQYLYESGCELQPRFDVVALTIKAGGRGFQVLAVQHIENAYEAEETHALF